MASLLLLSIGGFFGWQSISLVLLSLGWIPLSGEFVASYPYVDSFGDEVSIYPHTTSTNPIIFFV